MASTQSTCNVTICTRPRQARGWCYMHYQRWRRNGNPLKTTATPRDISTAARFWSQVQKTDSCWLWTGTVINGGYGQFSIRARGLMAHRVAYTLRNGGIPDGLTLDHLCRVRLCVNPSHLEPVTQQVNTLRGDGFAAQNAVKTHCKQGHEFTESNTYSAPSGRRVCRSCGRRWTQEYRQRKLS